MDIRKLLADESTVEEVSTIFKEIKKEFAGSSDRGVTIISASMLDSQLYQILEQVMVFPEKKKSKNDFFSNNGPLSSFSNKIQIAFGFGLISDFERNLLNNIRLIRNEFAHQIKEISFENDKISGLCHNLSIPDDLLVSLDIDEKLNGEYVIYKPLKKNKREVFQTAVYVAITMLAARKVQLSFILPEKTPDFKHRKEYTIIQINAQNHFQEILQDTINKVENKTIEISDAQYEKFKKQQKESIERMAFLEEQRVKDLSSIVIEKEGIYKDSSSNH